MDQLYDFSGTLRSMTIEKSLFKRLGPFWKEEKADFLEKREFDSHGRLVVREYGEYREMYAYLAEGENPDFRRAALYRFGKEGNMEGREVWHYSDVGTLRGKEIYDGDAPVRLVEVEEDRGKGVIIEKEQNLIRGKQYDRKGRLVSEYIYRDSEADLIIRYGYSENGFISKKEETDRNGKPVKTTLYVCDEAGLIREIRELDREGEPVYHRVFEYPGGNDENWLVREEYALNGRGKKIPLSLVYRTLNFFHQPRLVADEEEADPPSPRPEPAPPLPEVEKGSRAFANGFYSGELHEGQIEGKGEFSFNDGSRYRGDFRYGRPEGKGELAGSDGSFYRGDFKNGKMHGRGKIKWPDGSRYEGPFSNGLMDGIGLFTWPNGDRFKGLFEKGRRTDQGLVERNE